MSVEVEMLLLHPNQHSDPLVSTVIFVLGESKHEKEHMCLKFTAFLLFFLHFFVRCFFFLSFAEQNYDSPPHPPCPNELVLSYEAVRLPHNKNITKERISVTVRADERTKWRDCRQRKGEGVR